MIRKRVLDNRRRSGLRSPGCPIGDRRQIFGGRHLTGNGRNRYGAAGQLGQRLAPRLQWWFRLRRRLANGDAYSVTVKTQPSNPAQTCTVRNGSGTIDKSDVTNVLVSCTQTGRFAFVANRQSNNLSAFAIDSASGALLPIAVRRLRPPARRRRRWRWIPMENSSMWRTTAPNNVSVYSIDPVQRRADRGRFPDRCRHRSRRPRVDPTRSVSFRRKPRFPITYRSTPSIMGC